MIISIGNDHAGTQHKKQVQLALESKGIKVVNHGTDSDESVDYPDYAHLVAQKVSINSGFGILICGSGNGVSMAANKHQGIRCAICWNEEITKLARQHNDANIISLPARFLSIDKCMGLITIFLKETFEGGRHLRRVEKI